jgi:hypothetical protein
MFKNTVPAEKNEITSKDDILNETVLKKYYVCSYHCPTRMGATEAAGNITIP